MFPLQRLLEISESDRPAALCTVIGTQGSTPRKAGASMVVFADGTPEGSIEGTIGGGAIEHAVRRAALLVIATTRPLEREFSLTTQLGMCCGGKMRVFIEPLRQRPPCIIFGAGHVGAALARFADASGFSVTVADPRDELMTKERLGDVAMVLDYEAEDLDKLPFGPDAFVVVLTHDHPTDQRLVEQCLPRSYRYLAMIGSQRKARLTRERCRNRGLDPALVDRLHSPAGLDIGAETAEEIAVSILAQMIEVRRTAEATSAAPGDSDVVAEAG